MPDAPCGLEVEYTADDGDGVLGAGGRLSASCSTTRCRSRRCPTRTDAAPSGGPAGAAAGPDALPRLPDLAPDPLVLPSPATPLPAGTVSVPRPITAAPVDELTFMDSVEFDRERCYDVRAVRGAGPGAVESAPTERRCVTPVDVFAPEPPAGLSAVVREGAISLIWEPSPDADVWGYVVLRGAPGDATLQPLNAAPVIETQFTDTTVMAGTRYVYAVLAVDSRLPVPNRAPSRRASRRRRDRQPRRGAGSTAMKLFADTGNLKELEALASLGILDGVTTNPSLMAKESGDPRQILKQICRAGAGPGERRGRGHRRRRHDSRGARPGGDRRAHRRQGAVHQGRREGVQDAGVRRPCASTSR